MRFKALVAAITLAAISLLALAFPVAAAYNPLGPACQNAPSNPACQQSNTQISNNTNPAVDIIHTAANIIAGLGGVAAVIVIVISGFMFVTAGGASPGQRGSDPNKIKSARSALTGAIVGLVIIALAWVIVTFATDKLIG